MSLPRIKVKAHVVDSPHIWTQLGLDGAARTHTNLALGRHVVVPLDRKMSVEEWDELSDLLGPYLGGAR